MDKAEWREAWERVLPILTFEDKYKIAEARNVKLGNGQRLSKISKNSTDDYRSLLIALWQDIMNQRKNKKIFLSWLNPYQDEESDTRYNEGEIKSALQEKTDKEDDLPKWRILAALLLTRIPELQAIALDYLNSLPPLDMEAMREAYIDELLEKIRLLEKTNNSLQKKFDFIEAQAKKSEERMQDSLKKQNQLKQRTENIEKDNNQLYKEKSRLEKELQRLRIKQGDDSEDIQTRLELAYSKGRVCWVRSTPHPFEEDVPNLSIQPFQFGKCTEEDYKVILQYLAKNAIHEILVDPAIIPSGDVFLMQKLIQKKELPIVIVKQAEKDTLATIKEL